MNRRMIALLLAAVLVLALTGCAKKEHSEGKPKTDLLATTQPVYQLTCALTDGQVFPWGFSSPSPSRACMTTRSRFPKWK